MPRDVKPVALLTTSNRLEFFVRGDSFATYAYNEGAAFGFTKLQMYGERAVVQTHDGEPAIYVSHGNVNGVVFDHSDIIEGGPQGGNQNSPEENAGEQRDAKPVGSIVTEDMEVRRGLASVGFRHTCAWRDPGRNHLLTQTLSTRITPGPSEGGILDMRIQLQAPDNDSVVLGRTDIGLLCLRAAPPLSPSGTGQIRNSLGDYGPAAISGKNALWCACVGVVKSITVGFVCLDHPANPVHPTPFVARADGFLSANPFLYQAVTLPPRGMLSFRYRLLAHVGYVEAGWAGARLSDYSREHLR